MYVFFPMAIVVLVSAVASSVVGEEQLFFLVGEEALKICTITGMVILTRTGLKFRLNRVLQLIPTSTGYWQERWDNRRIT